MAITTSSQMSNFYNTYREVDITFTKEVIRGTLLNPKQVFLKLKGSQWPCIIYSSSLSSSKIIANITPSLKKAIQDSNGSVSIRFSFLQKEKKDSISFFVPCKVSGFTPYRNNNDNSNLHFINLNFTQRPPDDLIEILGRVLEANTAAHNRKDERVVITNDNISSLGLASKAGILIVDKKPLKCVLRDISFGGTKIIMMGAENFLLKKTAILSLNFTDPHERIDIPGVILRFEAVQGREDLGAFAVQFSQETTPMRFKLRLNNYFGQRAQKYGNKSKNKKEEQDGDKT